MFKWLLENSLTHRLLVLMTAAVLMAYGAFTLSRTPVDVFPDQIVGRTYLQIDINREKAARYGVNVADIQETIEVAMGGKAFTVFTGELSAVRSGVNAAVSMLKDEGVLDSFAVIPAPHKDLIAKLL